MIIREETYWKQRSRVIWLKVGDRNTAFFHRSASIDKRRNNIDNIKDDNNVKLNKPEEIRNQEMAYFSNSSKEEQRDFREEDQ